MFAKGLHAGLTGDHLAAVHLLTPQIENSVRHILSSHGELTSGFTKQEAQHHYDLNRVLNNPRLEAKLIQILGEDLVFQLKALLIHRYGANLRNEIAHGTLGVDEINSGFYGLQSVYLWWLALRLCLTCMLPDGEEEKAKAAATTETETAAMAVTP